MHEIELFPEVKLVVVTFQGAPNLGEIKQSLEELATNPDLTPEFQGVVDYRWCEIDMTVAEVKELADHVKSNYNGGRPWVMMVDGPKNTALGTMYAEMVKGCHVKTLFSTVEAASEYLDIDLSQYLHLKFPA